MMIPNAKSKNENEDESIYQRGAIKLTVVILVHLNTSQLTCEYSERLVEIHFDPVAPSTKIRHSVPL